MRRKNSAGVELLSLLLPVVLAVGQYTGCRSLYYPIPFLPFASRCYWKLKSKLDETTISINNSSDEYFSGEQGNLMFSGVARLYTAGGTFQDGKRNEYVDILDRLQGSHVIVVGVGGVGSWAAEALCRSGVGQLTLIDLDDICISNTNRQVHTMRSSIGKMKIDVMKERLSNINPDCRITLIHDFVSNDNVDTILSNARPVSACLDAIDGSMSKTALIAACSRNRIPIVTCGGSAGRTDPTKFVCEDLTRVKGDPLLSSCRKTLRQCFGFDEGYSFRDEHGKVRNKLPRKWNIAAVYSTEPQKVLPVGDELSSFRRCDGALGTACFVTGTLGFVAAGKVTEMIANDALRVPRRFKSNLPRD